MKKTLISAAFATRFAAQAIAAPQTYSLDPTHSFPRFSYDHMGMSNQILRFNKTTGTVVLDQAAKQAPVDETGRAHVCTPVTNAQLVCRLLLETKKHKHTIHIQSYNKQNTINIYSQIS